MPIDITTLRQTYYAFYAKHNFNLNPIVWDTTTDYIQRTFNDSFREDNAYLWQFYFTPLFESFYTTLKSIPETNTILQNVTEDGSFGCITKCIDDKVLSRDLLESVIEIYFLQSEFPNFSQMTVLDVGAGYGRLCKRVLECFPNMKYYITDGIPESTYYSQIYLGENNKHVLPLYDLLENTNNMNIDLAINIHSFPECNIEDVAWWLRFLSEKKVTYIMYVPNDIDSTSDYLPNNNKESLLDLFSKYGYKIIVERNMYKELNLFYYNYGAVPFFLFKRI